MVVPVTEASLSLLRDSLGFAAAHFGLLPGGRETLHGHNYRVGVVARGEVGAEGTVVDFGALKAAVRAECEALDHRMLVPSGAPEVEVGEPRDGHVALGVGDHRFVFPAGDVAVLPVRNTTCECLAAWLLERVRARLGGARVQLAVTVEESPGQGATVADEPSGSPPKPGV